MDLEPRLIRRYHQLVRSHMMTSNLLSSGVKNSLKSNMAFSQTQAAWRFFNNERCELMEFVKPMLESAKNQEDACLDCALIAHDWSGLIYKNHESKNDRFGVHNKQELGYELQASVLLNDRDGGPISPIALNVVTDKKVLSTYDKDAKRDDTHLEELEKRIQYLESYGFKKPLVHIIDREGDSVQLMRALGGIRWLIRCRSNSRIEFQGISLRVDALAKKLVFSHEKTIQYKGQKAALYLSETAVSISRPAKPKRPENGKRKITKGESVKCRLIVSKIQDDKGNILASWYLLTNVESICISVIAQWYYWRWSIESFFKLLKSAGMQLESWQQESGEAIARRLLIACMACVLVWQIANAKGPEASELRKVLIRLSGTQMRYGIEFTKPALFKGLCSLLNTLDLLEKYDPTALKQMLYDLLGEAFV